jgi:hypothetical protein
VRKQYHFWPGSDGLDAWDVDRLVELCRDLPAVAVEISSISEVDSVYWFDEKSERPRLETLPEPDYRNCRPEELPYE